MGEENLQNDPDLNISEVTLRPDFHYTRTDEGITILKSGHQLIHNHFIRHAQPMQEAAAILDRLLHDPEFHESTFDAKFRPTSIFRGLSRKPLVSPSYIATLSANLETENPMVVRRSAKILIRVLTSAMDYPDVRTFLYCYFCADSVAPNLFTTFLRARLRAAKSQGELDREYKSVRAEMTRFRQKFRPKLGSIGSLRASDEEAFSIAYSKLVERFESQKLYRLLDP